jgi:hypothetical protein
MKLGPPLLKTEYRDFVMFKIYRKKASQEKIRYRSEEFSNLEEQNNITCPLKLN